MEKDNQVIKWSLARQAIHIAYDYDNENEPNQWDFISNIKDEDLIELHYYFSLQKYTKAPMIEYNISWNNLNELIKLEANHRQINL
jgi:hypothetical protein